MEGKKIEIKVTQRSGTNKEERDELLTKSGCKSAENGV